MERFFVQFSVVLATCVLFCGATESADGDSVARYNAAVSSSVNATSNRSSKFLSLFSVVRFDQNQCIAYTNYTGTCMTSVECSAEGGIAGPSCASGFGVCCVFLLSSCGTMSSRNCTYIVNPSTLAQTQTCVYMINKCSSNVCQIRLDFFSLSIANPTDSTSVCDDDKFIVTGGTSTAPTICGKSNAGQHMYIDVTSAPSIKLNFVLSSATAITRSWTIKATQVTCDSRLAAPANCLQYFTYVSGTISSFNFDTTSSAVSRKHLANQDQSMCFRMEQNYCSICFSTCPTPAVTAAASFAVSGPSGGTYTGYNCTLDYMLIPGGYNQGFSTVGTMSADRICGTNWSAMNTSTTAAVVCTSRKPFRLQFISDGGTTATMDPEGTSETGFCLRYTQIPC